MRNTVSSTTDIELRTDNPVWTVLVVVLFHAIVLTVGFFTLVMVFDFPDVLS